MKMSIRSKFNVGILVFFTIIVVLLVFSSINLNKLSNKTNLILSENHSSVGYARMMSEELTNINQVLTYCFLSNKNFDFTRANNSFLIFDNSLGSEKKIITEIGEGELVKGIENEYNEYRDSLKAFTKGQQSINNLILLQKKYIGLNHKIMLLSQLNSQAIELKTNDAKNTAKKALMQMSIIGVICFLFVLSFTFNFASYFNERFFQLYNGIKEIAISNYGQRLHFDGKDEFYEISVVFNEMAEKLYEEKQKKALPLNDETPIIPRNADVEELKRIIAEIKQIEEQAIRIISSFENKK